jgi:hypothetical protein
MRVHLAAEHALELHVRGDLAQACQIALDLGKGLGIALGFGQLEQLVGVA